MEEIWFIRYRDFGGKEKFGYFEKSFMKDNMHIFDTIKECNLVRPPSAIHTGVITLNMGFENYSIA